MNVWSALPRSLASSRCLHAVRSLLWEGSSSIIRHSSTNTPASTDKSPEDHVLHLAKLLNALTQADAQRLAQHSPPRLQTPSEDLIRSPFKGPKRKKKGSRGDKKAASKDEAKTMSIKRPAVVPKSALDAREEARKGQQQEIPHLYQNSDFSSLSKILAALVEQETEKQIHLSTQESHNEISPSPSDTPTIPDEPLSPSQNLEATHSGFVSDTWPSEPWATTVLRSSLPEQDDTRPSVDDIDRSSPPHILEQKVVSDGKLIPSVTNALVDLTPVAEHLPVATLAHGLERVLFNPGVHWLRDPRSGIYNFSPWLEKIPKVNDFAFERLTGFVKSSRDEELRVLAKQENKKFAGSTSSLSGMLSHVYFLLSEHKEVDFSVLSQHFKNQPARFTAGQMMPATVLLNYKDGVYAIDSRSTEWDDPDKNILTWLGTLLENFLTKSSKEFKSFLRAGSAPIDNDERPLIREAFRFAKSDNFVMRSQLDCQDHRLPGTGVFDIKTRACISLRMDILNYEENSGYLIKSQHGYLESFEREYYDLIRSAFLKYSFQARIGNMDGVMVAYHNTEQIFGFQYIPLLEMDERLFGPEEGIGERVFNKCIGLLEAILPEAAACYPEQSVRCTFETVMPGRVLTVFVQPDDWTGDEQQWPIKKLNVTVEHFLDSVPTRGTTAMRSTNNDWTMTYNIGISSRPDSEIRSDYKHTMNRKKRTLILPSSVPFAEAEKYWENLVFHQRAGEFDDVPRTFRPEGFTTVSTSVEKYRELARAGRLLTERLAREEAGRPKIVLGEGVYVPEEE
ncbi:Pet127-domain-containing protein [Phlegmacium glaucopus]|nr:Pet127-domain-containing protein [Phlegmacium glaucopus]